MKKITPIISDWFDQLIKQNVMGNKPKIIRDKLNRKKIRDIWHILKQEKKKKKKGIREKEKKLMKD